MRRIAICGNSGSGKSRLAAQIATATGLPLIHLDQHHYLPGWTVRPKDEWEAWHCDAVQRDAWILDGNFTRTLPERVAAANLIIFLDVPVWLCLWRVAKRAFTNYGRILPDMPQGCPEKFDPAFFVNVWAWRHDQRRPNIDALNAAGTDNRVVIIRRSRDVAAVWGALGVSPPGR